MAASLDDLKIDRSRKRHPALKWTLWVLVLLVAIGGGGAAAWQWWTESQVLTVVTAVVRQTTAGDGQPTVLNASGYVTARRQATVSSKVTGKVMEVLVEEGMAVRKGQVLARLDDSTEHSYLALAEAQVRAERGALTELEVRHAEAVLELDRNGLLLRRGIIGQAEFDTSESEVDWLAARIANQREQVTVSEREIDVRRTAIADMVIRAPFAGVAITKDAQPGEMISPVSAGGGFTRTGICTIVDMSSLEIEVDVNESYINRVSDAQRVVATLDAYPDWQIPGSVIITIPAADRQRATVLVRIGFDQLDPRILPDMGVGVAFLEAGREEESVETSRLWVPVAAVVLYADQPFVFVLRGEEVERRAIGLGLEDGTDVEVTAGLAAGERVVLEAPLQLADGDRVAVG